MLLKATNRKQPRLAFIFSSEEPETLTGVKQIETSITVGRTAFNYVVRSGGFLLSRDGPELQNSTLPLLGCLDIGFWSRPRCISTTDTHSWEQSPLNSARERRQFGRTRHPQVRWATSRRWGSSVQTSTQWFTRSAKLLLTLWICRIEVSMAHGRRSSLAVHLWHFQLRCGQETLLGDLVMVSEAIQPEPGLLTLTRCPLRHVR